MALSQLVRHPTSLWQDHHQNMATQDNIEAGVGVGVGVEAGTGEGVAAEAHIADGRVGHAPGQDHVRHPTGPGDPPVLPTNEADSIRHPLNSHNSLLEHTRHLLHHRVRPTFYLKLGLWKESQSSLQPLLHHRVRLCRISLRLS